MVKLSESKIQNFKNAILGRDFDLSVAYVSRAQMRVLNKQHRKIDAPTDVLSFSYSKTSGELILCLPEVTTHARAWDATPARYLPYLVIHGMVHVKGHDHGRIMTRLEKKYCRTLGVLHPGDTTHGTKDRSRDRRGHVPGTRRRLASRRRTRVS